MKSFTQRVLQAYRPLYLHGLRMDGHYRRPAVATAAEPSSARKRMLLVALCGLARPQPSARSSS